MGPPDPGSPDGARGVVDAHHLNPSVLKVEQGSAGAASHVEDPAPDESHGLTLNRAPVLEIREVQLGTGSDRDVAVITLDNLPRPVRIFTLVGLGQDPGSVLDQDVRGL